MKKEMIKNWAILAGLIIVFIIMISNINWWESALRFLFPNESIVIYQRISLNDMIIQHLKIVTISSGLTIITGVPLGIIATRSAGRDFQGVLNSLISIGQTFPPVAVLALAVPVFGFGLVPTIIALFLYGLLPVVRNTIAGLKSVPEHILDSAYGLGMSRLQALFRIELPLSLKVIIAGIRISVIINIGTAMIGAVIGAGGLGSPIIAGLVQDNIAYIIEGVVPAAFIAIIADRFFSNFEGLFLYSSGINQ